jgi:hypothetical protein
VSGERWIRGPLGLDAQRWSTRADCRGVLVPVPHVAAGTRLLDLVQLLEQDHRVQVIFTVPDTTESWHGTEDFVRRHGGLAVPWIQAVQQRFDLVLAASYTQLSWVRGRIMVVPHGAGSMMSRSYNPIAGPGAEPYAGLGRGALTFKGRLLPSVIALTHDTELAMLRQSCPEAVSAAIVVGDICFDRMLAGCAHRERYRRDLGVDGDQRLITVSSTWSCDSVFGRHPILCQRLVAELPSDHRVALVLHPNVWAVHGYRQVEAWLAAPIERGLLLIPPDEGWRATMIASDLVIGDHGSTTQYAAAIGRPIVLASYPDGAVRRDSTAAAIARRSPRLDPCRDLFPQVDRAIRHQDDGAIAGLVTSRPEQSAALLRRAMYDLLELPEPVEPALARPVPAPRPVSSADRWEKNRCRL